MNEFRRTVPYKDYDENSVELFDKLINKYYTEHDKGIPGSAPILVETENKSEVSHIIIEGVIGDTGVDELIVAGYNSKCEYVGWARFNVRAPGRYFASSGFMDVLNEVT